MKNKMTQAEKFKSIKQVQNEMRMSSDDGWEDSMIKCHISLMEDDGYTEEEATEIMIDAKVGFFL
jgi:hypothetical protein